MSGIVHTRREADLEWITDAGVVAVIYLPPEQPPWMSDLVSVVESGAFVLPRTVLADCDRDEIDSWLGRNLPPLLVADRLHEDVLALLDRLRALTNCDRFMVRLVTAVPNSDCGFHIDTVIPGAPPWGLLRVYGNAGTAYIEPSNLSSVDSFYRYLGKRERLERDLQESRRRGSRSAALATAGEILEIDRQRDFLVDPDGVHVTPPESIVAFKHLDQRLYWSRHEAEQAWIHCSPMIGSARLVVNLTAIGRSPDLDARFQSTMSR